MKEFDDATLERIIEEITRQVMILVREEGSGPSAEKRSPLTEQNYLRRAQPVIEAGADRLGARLGAAPKNVKVGPKIDHTLLKPDATQDQIAQLCFEAKKYGFASVCVNPTYVALCSELLAGTEVAVCTVIGFPLGATATEVKVFETQQAIRNGASEVDMVIDVGALKSRDYELVRRDIAAIARATHAGNAMLKVIIETALLTDEEKVVACQLAKVAGADYVKTSTGFGPGGATAEDVALMRQVVGPDIGVKASGGIRTFDDAQKMIAAGASRLGVSASIKIIQGEPA